MKKLLCLILSLLLLVSLAACGSKPATETTPDTTAEPSVGAETEEAIDPDDQPEEGYVFSLPEMDITPGGAFDPQVMPEADSTFEIESCAGQGTDTVYSYPEAEVTVFSDGANSIVYSIYLMDPNTATPEGLYLGDEKTQAETIYGTNYTEEDTELVYTKGITQLRLLIEDDVVTAIEYRLITE